MNRREFLTTLRAVATLANPQQVVALASLTVPLRSDPIRREFLDARGKAGFWLGLDQLAEPLPYLRRAWQLAPHSATVKEKAEILQHLRDCELQLGISKDFVRQHKHLLSGEPSAVGLYWLVARALQRIGNHGEAVQIFSWALDILPRTWSSDRGLFVVQAAFSQYCLGNHQEVLRQVREALANIAEGETAVTPSLLECEILSFCALGLVERAKTASSEYAHRFGALPGPHHHALHTIGVDFHSIYLEALKGA